MLANTSIKPSILDPVDYKLIGKGRSCLLPRCQREIWVICQSFYLNEGVWCSYNTPNEFFDLVWDIWTILNEFQ